MKVCALTGAHGYVGSALRRGLTAAGWTVVACMPVPGTAAPCTAVDCTADCRTVAAGSPPPPPPAVTSGWVCWVQTDPSHQRSKLGVPYGSGYQPEGGKSMSQG